MTPVLAIVPAAGSSTRMAELGAGFSKILHKIDLGNSSSQEIPSVLSLTLHALLSSGELSGVVLAVREQEREYAEELLAVQRLKYPKLSRKLS